MKNIQLNETQQNCVDAPIEQNLIVQGVAGSGKSLVILKRAIAISEAMKNAKKPFRILILTYNKSLARYSREVLYANGKGAVVEVFNIDKIIKDCYDACPLPNWEKKIGPYQTKKELEVLDDVIKTFPIPREEALQRIISEPRREWLRAELAWMKQHAFTEENAYVECQRSGRGLPRVERKERPFIFSIYQRYYDTLLERGVLTYDMMAAHVYETRKSWPKKWLYDVVMVDEAQDLALTTLKIAATMAKTSLTLAADFAQKIYANSFDWKEMGIAFDRKSRFKLKGTYRNTKEIVEFSMGLLRHNTELKDQEGITSPTVPDKSGDLPKILYATGREDHDANFMEIVTTWMNWYPQSTLGILCRKYDQMKYYKEMFDSAEIDYEEVTRHEGEGTAKILTPGIKFSTYHSAKGLEFDAVILPEVDEAFFPGDDPDVNPAEYEALMNEARRLLYVGVTRARKNLFIFATNGENASPSPLLFEFEENTYQALGNVPERISVNRFETDTFDFDWDDES